MSVTEPQSPCISACMLDEQDICVGCFRSGVEIVDWFIATPQEKVEILERVQQRILASTTTQLK